MVGCVCSTHGDMVDLTTRLRKILDSLDDVFIDLERRVLSDESVDYVFSDLNPPGEVVLRATREELLGRGIYEIFPNERVRGMVLEFEDVRRAGRPVRFERRVHDPRFEPWFTYVVIPTPEGVALIARVITEGKRIEEAHAELKERLRHTQKMESLGRLAGGIAHDFNNLLTPILAYAQLALERLSLDDPLYEEVTEIQGAAERASGLVREILHFGRKASGTVAVVSINDVVSGFAGMLRRLVREGVELRLELAPNLDTARCDPLQIEQILANLIVNASDALSGGGRIVVRTSNATVRAASEGRPRVPEGRYVVVSVLDNGPGIDPEVVERVFEPFFTTKEQGGGTGLGLAIVYDLVTQRGGYVACLSERGRGTEFRVYLPRCDVAAPVTPLPHVVREGPQVGEGVSVLVVEGDATVRRLVGNVLTRKGFTVQSAESAAAAIESVRAGSEVDVLVADVRTPELDGRVLFDALSAMRPGLRAVLMSSSAAASEGDRWVLVKPFSASALVFAVLRALRG